MSRAEDHFPIVRRKNFTVTEIFAFVGGLLGLFLGISVVSFAEIVNMMLQPLFLKLSKTSCFRKKPLRVNTSENKSITMIRKFKSYLSFYLKESSIHSFNFMANGCNGFEKIFWILSFSFSMTGCVLMILNLYQTMDFKAVTLIIDDKAMDVSQIPFPAVTISAIFKEVGNAWANDIKEFDEIDILRFNGLNYSDVSTENIIDSGEIFNRCYSKIYIKKTFEKISTSNFYFKIYKFIKIWDLHKNILKNLSMS